MIAGNSREVEAMTVAMIPDQPGREAAFEPLLDELLAIFCPGWEMPQIMICEHQHHRCEVKRYRLGEAAEADRDLTRRHADLLTRAATHDQCPSGIRQLILPLVNTLGYRSVQSTIVDYVLTGTNAEMVGATMAWYAAQSPLKYGSSEDFKNRIPTKESKAERDSLADLRDAYRAACLESFLACEDPGTRHDLALWIDPDPASYPERLRSAQQHAWKIITGAPAHYRLILQRSGFDAPPQA
ncbi:hypothetical protein ACIQNG_37785 [Streptomyces sp. NPDC091377]|uniref:hypothetical protein n=1 Tax=Streptomyces sp. NPDC091377 TaxID=3365995 RepID=UPI00381709F4